VPQLLNVAVDGNHTAAVIISSDTLILLVFLSYCSGALGLQDMELTSACAAFLVLVLLQLLPVVRSNEVLRVLLRSMAGLLMNA
jgi:hypothetical protein